MAESSFALIYEWIVWAHQCSSSEFLYGYYKFVLHRPDTLPDIQPIVSMQQILYIHFQLTTH